MKTKKMFALVAYALFSASCLSLVSCEKQEVSQEPVHTGQKKTTTTDEYVFNKHLNTAAIGVLELSRLSSFKTMVNNRVSEQWDGDDNVLLSTLKEDLLDVMSLDMNSEFRSAISQHGTGVDVYTAAVDIDLTLSNFNAFQDVNHPQIYIPFVSDVNLNDDPVICVGYSDGETLVGFKLDSDNNLVTLEVDETFAQNNLVWVLSVNESINLATPTYTSGDPVENYVGAAGDGQITNKDKRTTHNKELWINSIYYGGAKRETWFQGKYELAFSGAHYDKYTYAVFRVEDKKIVEPKPKRSTFNSTLVVGAGLHHVPSKVASDQNSAMEWAMNEDVGGLFYEYDKGKSSKTWHLAFNGGPGVHVSYRSEDSPYGNIYGVFSALGSDTFWKFTPEVSITDMRVSFKHREI